MLCRGKDLQSPFAIKKKERKQSWEMRLDPTLHWKGARVLHSQLRSPVKHHSSICSENVDIIPCSANIFSVWKCSELWQSINIFFGRQSFSQKPNWVEKQVPYLKNSISENFKPEQALNFKIDCSSDYLLPISQNHSLLGHIHTQKFLRAKEGINKFPYS